MRSKSLILLRTFFLDCNSNALWTNVQQRSSLKLPFVHCELLMLFHQFNAVSIAITASTDDAPPFVEKALQHSLRISTESNVLDKVNSTVRFQQLDTASDSRTNIRNFAKHIAKNNNINLRT